MKDITQCLNEWNVIIEALGQGKQTILIRKYRTNINEFLLYPTIGYANDKYLLNMFKENEREFVENNLYSIKEDKLSNVKYYATVEEIFKKPLTDVEKYDKFHIWSTDHVKRFFFMKKEMTIWILRVYELDEPQMLKMKGSMRFGNVDKNVKLEGKPIISDSKFNKLKKEIINIE